MTNATLMDNPTDTTGGSKVSKNTPTSTRVCLAQISAYAPSQLNSHDSAGNEQTGLRSYRNSFNLENDGGTTTNRDDSEVKTNG